MLILVSARRSGYNITDDIYGTNSIVLTGADAELFEIREAPGRDRLVKELWLKAGVDLGAPERPLKSSLRLKDGRGA